MPICCKCGIEKPQSEFYSGRTECKPCKKAISWDSKKLRLESDPQYRSRRNSEIREWKSRNKSRVSAWKNSWNKTELGRLARRLRKRQERPVGRGVAKHCQNLLIAQRHRCAICSGSLKDRRHLDHIVPIAAGGLSEIGNLQWLCPTCNISKAAKDPIVHMQSLGRLL